VNIGNTEEVTMENLAKIVKQRTGSSSPIQFVPYDKAYEPGFEDMMRRVPCIDKLHALTGFRPQTSLVEIIDRVSAISARRTGSSLPHLRPSVLLPECNNDKSVMFSGMTRKRISCSILQVVSAFQPRVPLCSARVEGGRPSSSSRMEACELNAESQNQTRKYERFLFLLFLLTLPLMNPWVRGDGVGYYAYARAPLIEHSLDFTHDYSLPIRAFARPCRFRRPAPRRIS